LDVANAVASVNGLTKTLAGGADSICRDGPFCHFALWLRGTLRKAPVLLKTTKTNTYSFKHMIEPLENRIAPSAIVRFFEADGDKITVKTNKGTNAELLVTLTDQNGVAITPGETGITSFTVNLLKNATTTAAFAGTNLTITASGGAGPTKNKANFASINAFDGGAAGIDLKNVIVKGRLVFIDAGDSDLDTFAIKNLTVIKMGPSDGSDDATISEIQGNIKTVIVKDDFDGYFRSEDASGTPNFKTDQGTKIGKFFVADNIASKDGDNVGHLQINNIANLIVKGTFFGPLIAGINCGLIEALSLDRISIHRMSINARIELSS
jgi:hypothetical protein